MSNVDLHTVVLGSINLVRCEDSKLSFRRCKRAPPEVFVDLQALLLGHYRDTFGCSQNFSSCYHWHVPIFIKERGHKLPSSIFPFLVFYLGPAKAFICFGIVPMSLLQMSNFELLQLQPSEQKQTPHQHLHL